jgi:hypothetical protein
MHWKGYDNERNEDLSAALAAFAKKGSGGAEQRRWDEHQPIRGHGSGGKARADFKAFDKLMGRRGGKRPRAGDELPSRTRGE